MKTDVIMSVTGIDGAYLAEFLLQKDSIVHGGEGRSFLFNSARIDRLIKASALGNCDFTFTMAI